MKTFHPPFPIALLCLCTNKLYASGKVNFQNGKTVIWDDVFEKVEADRVR